MRYKISCRSLDELRCIYTVCKFKRKHINNRRCPYYYRASVPLRVEVSPSNSDDSSSSGDEQGSKKSKKRGKRKKKKGKKTKKSRKSKSKKKKDGDEYESDDDSDDSSYVGYGIGSLDGSNSLVSNDSSAVFDSDSRDASNSTKKRKKVKKRGKKKVGKSQMSDSVSTLGDDNDDDKSYNYSTGVQSKNNNLHRKSLGIASDNIDDIDNVNDFDDIKKKRRAKLQARKTMIGQETGQEEVSEQADEGGAEEMSNKKEKTAALDGIDVALAGMSEYDRKYYKNMMHRIMLKENLLDKKIALAEMEISRKVREIIYGPAAVAHLEVREGVVIDPVPIDEIEKFRREQLASGHNQFGRNNSGRFLPSIDGSSPMQNRTRSFLQLIRSNDENDEEIINSMMETQMNAETLAEKKRNKMMLNSNDKERLLKHQSILNEVMSNIKAFKRSKAEGKLNENSKWNLIKIYAPQLDKRKNVGTSTDDLESSPIDKFPPLSTINTGIHNTNTDKMAMQGTSKGVIYAKNASKNNDDHENRGVGYTDSLSDAGDLTPRIPVNGRAPFTLSTKKRDKYELPIIDNRDNILITRTYKELPKNKTFQKILEESDNPLYEIYDYYGHLLNNTTKAKLLNCAATIHRIDDQIKSSNTYHKVLWSLLENILLVQSECDFMLNNVDIIEKIVSALLSMKDAGNSIDSKTIKAAIEDLNM